MASSHDSDKSRTRTDTSLREERDRSDEELLLRSSALAEDADAIIQRARERARMVLELTRQREDQQLSRIGARTEITEAVSEERRVEDATLAAERAAADAQRAHERELRRAALLQLLAHERDTTDRMLAAERSVADRSVGAREDLLAVVAHDLRGILNTIVVNASLVLLASDLESATRTAVGIQRASAQMSQLLEDLLDFSSFHAGKLTLAHADVDLVQLVQDAVSLHDAVAHTQDVALAMQSDAASLIIRADGRRLLRLLTNLIGNALKYTPQGGRVDVTLEVSGEECEIAVRDTGIGISEDQLHSIFERFQQVGTQPRRSSGVGLGLYIARLIAEAHGGRIWAESEPGAGSAFRVRLPINGAT